MSLLLRLLDQGEERLGRYGPLRSRRARIASSIAAHGRSAEGPLTLLQSEPALRLMASASGSQAAAVFTTLLRATSNRLHTAASRRPDLSRTPTII